MSAPPAQAQSGPAPAAPTGGPPRPPAVRKKAPVSIFTNTKKKPAKKPVPAPKGQSAPKAANGLSTAQQPANGTSVAASASGSGSESYREFDIVIKKSTLDQSLRYHALKFQTKSDPAGNPTQVNPYDQSQFERPISLHRRFAQDKAEPAEQSDNVKDEDDKTAELMSARRAERIAEREQNQRLIAPTGGDAAKPMHRKKPQKKVEEGYDDTNPKALKRQQLRYEESRPWHLEDAENKNVWVGSYEKPLSEQNIMFVFDGPNFNMIPVDKWYRFIQTNKVNIMNSEEVERQMSKKFRTPRWALNTHLALDMQRQEAHRQRVERMQAMKREQQDDDELFGGGDTGEYQADKDMLDMEYDDLNDFQDDDEGELYMDAEGEDGKEIERRVREEMRNAGLGGTGVKDEDLDPEEEYRQEQLAQLEEYKKSKKMRKRLMKREHKLEYESDFEDEYKYGSSSESDDSEEEEREKQEEERKKEELRKAALLNDNKSGASSRGTNTPTGRAEKKDQSRIGAALGKRPGSPDASDLSGNESSRKKVKSLSGRAVSATASNSARSLSPDAAKVPRAASGSGSGSDTDTSRAGRGPRIRLKHSPPGSPDRSRAASPTASSSRSGTPKPNCAAANPPGRDFPTLAEIKAAIPPTGVEIKALVARFRNKVGGRTKEFIELVKAAGTQDKASAKIMPKVTS